MTPPILASVIEAHAEARSRLLAAGDARGRWLGRLSSSALATAVACGALAAAGHNRQAVQKGLAWLAAHANPDGGWGDTPESPSNLATTLLCRSVFALAEAEQVQFSHADADAWLERRVGSSAPADLAAAVRRSYGDDLTFSAPILAFAAAHGRLPWSLVPSLPFALCALPPSWFRWLRLSVVSYGLPALVAIGLMRHRACGGGPASLLASAALRRLAEMCPDDGGFNEAPPLVGFVLLGLCCAGERGHPAALKGEGFLLNAQRADGSWPVEVDLRCWLSSLATSALSEGPGGCPEPIRERSLAFLLAAQRDVPDRQTGAAPGGWSWNDLPGAMPDADDTSAALIALHGLAPERRTVQTAATRGAAWLAGLQNRDGGLPTFCRGWGSLPFDRSCPELTAHALFAWKAWSSPGLLRPASRAIAYLERVQRQDGAWLPRWFGDQEAPDLQNPVWGTAMAASALAAWGSHSASRGFAWLADAQGGDGGWGAGPGLPPRIETTAQAVMALVGTPHQAAAQRGARWLVEHTCGGTVFPSDRVKTGRRSGRARSACPASGLARPWRFRMLQLRQREGGTQVVLGLSARWRPDCTAIRRPLGWQQPGGRRTIRCSPAAALRGGAWCPLAPQHRRIGHGEG